MEKIQKNKRQAQIAQAAYDLLEEQGYGGISMLKIARRAKASNETLYRWYGDKKGLFAMLVRENAEEVTRLLQQGLDGKSSAEETLEQLGPQLLSLLLGERAVSLNRAAAADVTGELSRELARAGRASVMPLVEGVFAKLCADMQKPTAKAALFADIYLRLLIGDLQIRRVSGGLAKPTQAGLLARAGQAQTMTLQLLKDSK